MVAEPRRGALRGRQGNPFMKALTYQRAHDVRVEDVPDPPLLESDDILVRVTAAAICGSDLHFYRGKLSGMPAGSVLGHEFMGVVEEAGKDVTRVKKGDRVVVPFAVSCGECFFCERDLYAACERTNPGRALLEKAGGIRPGAAMF